MEQGSDLTLDTTNVESNVIDSAKKSKFKRSTTKQVILALLANFSSIAPSMSLGFSAVAVPALTSSTNSHSLNDDEVSWFASIAALATPFGCVFAGPVADRFGRKNAMFCVNVVCFIGWLTIALAYYFQNQQYPILLVGRLITGLSTGLSSVPATIYMAEISTTRLRGVFCTWNTISFALGVLIVYILGLILKDYWGTVALISAVFPCIGLIFVSFLIPESPTWLIRKNRLDEAKASMCKIFGVKEYIVEVQEEIENLIKNRGVRKEKNKTLLEQLLSKFKHLTKPTCLRPFGLILVYFFFQQFAGTFVIVFFAINIVQEAGVAIDPYVTIVIIGVVRLLASVLVSYICKHFGRRPLSILSGSGMTLCMISLSIYIVLTNEYKNSEEIQSSLQIIPVLLLLFYFFTSTIGFLPLPFAMSAEMLPAKIRGTATGFASGVGYFFNFIAVKIYPTMASGMNRYGVFLFYGIVSLLGTIFIAVFLPETKGKSLQEIEEYFQTKPKKKVSLLGNANVEV